MNLLKLALESYTRLKHHRFYALTPEAKNTLAVFASALAQKRAAEGRSNSDQPSMREEMAQLIEKIAAAGVNLLQKRPGDAPPLPKPWTDPVTGAALPNPFDRSAPDLKAQTILGKRDPTLAEHYRQMAADPYGTLAKYQDDEAERKALLAIPYDENVHKLNPFLGTNETAKADFVKRDPDLAKFYQEEAHPVEIPLFGKNRNLTIGGRLAKDPATFALLKVAQRIHEQWNAEDKAALTQQRAEAEAALKKLDAEAAEASSRREASSLVMP
jgi:hypothetical protein